MPDVFIIAEAAQGFEGSPELSRLLIKAAEVAGADAIKFQLVYADDLAVPGYQYYDLFKQLEMPDQVWSTLRQQADKAGLGFYIDVLGPRSAEVARNLGADGVKIHSTCFFETPLIDACIDLAPNLLFSVGGITLNEFNKRLESYDLADRGSATIMYGYQAEPTPTERNNLGRIPVYRDRTGLDVGFMDHADGAGPDSVNLSVMALGLGVTKFEKHITLDRELELEDYISGLAPSEFQNYVTTLRRLSSAIGTSSLELSTEEMTYRGKALKRVVAADNLSQGHVIKVSDLSLLRPATEGGLFIPEEAIGKTLRYDVAKGQSIDSKDLV